MKQRGLLPRGDAKGDSAALARRGTSVHEPLTAVSTALATLGASPGGLAAGYRRGKRDAE
ncbi:hypothetical protein H6G97_18220 [Nostoc flagelliforme FACHB-838]|uniref:Uncharacterized protein n=1 Tax=Nostoc flagelliforme FACHB-838 TaxID=2692904 RepID=A0ABR8DRA3_9NOSO|nr:hypothetical protein [Nostoc flagelliforme FACHB-838]